MIKNRQLFIIISKRPAAVEATVWRNDNDDGDDNLTIAEELYIANFSNISMRMRDGLSLSPSLGSSALRVSRQR